MKENKNQGTAFCKQHDEDNNHHLFSNIRNYLCVLRDYEEKSVNKIFHNNDRRKTCVKSAFHLRFIYSSYKIACQQQEENPSVFPAFLLFW